MQIQRPLLFLCTLIMIFFSVACDPGVNFNQIIQNTSNHDIIIHRDLPDSSITVLSKSEVILYSYSGLGQTIEYEDCGYTPRLIDWYVSDSSLSLTKDLSKKENWLFAILKKSFKQGGACECRLIIHNSDIK